MKSTWFRRKEHHEFAKLIDEAGAHKGFRTYELYTAFLFFAFAALRQPVHKLTTGDICPVLEAEYMQQIARYPNPTKFAEAMGQLVLGLEAEPHDFLGDVYQSLGMADKDFAGQCFTPAAVCEMMAQMSFGEREPNPHHRIKISEPCCGGGAMLIATVEVLKTRNFGPRDFFCWATDISTACFHMSYVQFSLLGIPAIVTRGDALWPKDTDTHAPTFAATIYPFRDWQSMGKQAIVEITARARPRVAPITARTRTR